MLSSNGKRFRSAIEGGRARDLGGIDVESGIDEYLAFTHVSPLSTALKYGSIDVARVLWRAGAKWESHSADTANPFVWLVNLCLQETPTRAKAEERAKARELLLEIVEAGDNPKTDINTVCGYPVTHLAMRANDIELFRALVEKGGLTGEEKNPDGRTVMEGIYYFARIKSMNEPIDPQRKMFAIQAREIIRARRARELADGMKTRPHRTRRAPGL